MLVISPRAGFVLSGQSILGDRACLALGLKTGWPVVTAERSWAECDVGVQVIRIR
jgi:PIN domain nuclease of toxin-antitoxin system